LSKIKQKNIAKISNVEIVETFLAKQREKRIFLLNQAIFDKHGQNSLSLDACHVY